MESDDGAEGDNAMVSIPLDSESTYIIKVGFFEGTSGSCTLTVEYVGETTGETFNGNGGEVLVSDAMSYTFIPNSTGIWEIRSMNNDDCDPTLALYDSDGDLISESDDSLQDNNALLIMYLQAREEYTIHAGVFGDGTGSFTLRIAQSVEIPSNGGTIHVQKALGYYFTPDKSGSWEFLTSNNEDCDPIIFIYSADGENIAYDDDSAYESGNAFIVVDLEGGTTYFVFAEAYNKDSINYDLNISRG